MCYECDQEKEKMGWIYTFWDKKLERYVYVGLTDNFNERYERHLIESRKNNPLQLIEIEIKINGINNYDVTKMQFPLSELNNQERYFIRYFQTREYYDGCNLTDGGGGVRGYKFSEEYIRERMKPELGKSLGDLNPELSKQWHLTKNGNLTLFDVCLNSNKKVWWICEFGHEWEARIKNRNNGTGCPYCSGKKVCIDNCLATLNPELAKQWNYKKNKNLIPFDVTLNSHKKVWWICDKGHEWLSSVNNRNNLGNNCPYCAKENKKGENCYKAKCYKIISPKNEIFIIKGILVKFCKENILSHKSMRKLLYGQQKYYKGWKIEYSTDEEYLKYKNNKIT